MHYQQGVPSLQLQCPKAQDVHQPSLHQVTPSTTQLLAEQLNSKVHVNDAAAVTRDKEELETLSADLLAGLSVLVLRRSGIPPREVAMALDSECSVAVRLGAKPPTTGFGGRCYRLLKPINMVHYLALRSLMAIGEVDNGGPLLFPTTCAILARLQIVSRLASPGSRSRSRSLHLVMW